MMNGETREETVCRLKKVVKQMRLNALDMAFGAGRIGAHLGPAMSCMEIMATLYCEVMRQNPLQIAMPERDRFIPSKAHCVLAFYTALHEAGWISEDELRTFEKNGTFLAGHPAVDLKHGIEYSGGSLGMALSVGIGVALNAKLHHLDYKTFMLLGDGELDEGSNWEALLSAPHFKLDNLVAIIDRNVLQYDGPTEQVMPLESIGDKLRAFHWYVSEVNGHDFNALLDAFNDSSPGMPHCIIANTIKGKGISFMENVREWHHGSLNQSQYEQAVKEVKEN